MDPNAKSGSGNPEADTTGPGLQSTSSPSVGTSQPNEQNQSSAKIQEDTVEQHSPKPESPRRDATTTTGVGDEYDEKQRDALFAMVEKAHKRAENARNDTERTQALQVQQWANATLSERFNTTLQIKTVPESIALAKMSTKDTWNEENPRQQSALPAKSGQQEESFSDHMKRFTSPSRQSPPRSAIPSELSTREDGNVPDLVYFKNGGPSSSENASDTKDALLRKMQSAEERWRMAPLRSAARNQAFADLTEAENALNEHFPEPIGVNGPTDDQLRSKDSILEEMLRAREQAEFAPSAEERSQAFQDMEQAARSLHERYPNFDGSGIPPEKHWNLAESRLLDAPLEVLQKEEVVHVPIMSTPDLARLENPRSQRPLAPKTANVVPPVKLHDFGQQSGASHLQEEDQKRDFDPAVLGWGEFLKSRFRSPEDEDDLEAGKKSKKSKKDEYDVHGRKRIVGRKRKERQQHPKDPKANYSPGVMAGPEPTYLDKHGRTELEVFQSLVGIYFLANAGAPLPTAQKTLQPASVMSDIFVPSRAAAYRHRNRGLYDRCISQDMKMRVMYSFSHYMITFLYLLQILVAATLTGLSSYTNTAGIALTTLGAINTVLAGILAWLNGQGMPVRYRRARDQFREVVRAIEDAERMFSTIDYMEWEPGTRPTPVGERDRLFRLYEKARQDEEANYPDTHENADKSEIAGNAKILEAKIEKHKKQKKEKSEELKAMQEQVQKLSRKLAGGRDDDSVASKSDDADDYEDGTNDEKSVGVEKPSNAKIDQWAAELDMRHKSANEAMAKLAKEKKETVDFFNAAQREIDRLCAEKELDASEARKRTKTKDAFKSK